MSYENNASNIFAQAAAEAGQGYAAESTVQAEPKTKAEPTTAKHARFLAKKAGIRAEKATAAHAEARAEEARYLALAETLPEGSTATPAAQRPVYEVGAEVTFRYGRTTATSTARVLAGVVKARKDDDAGKPLAYRVAIGEGFDEELFTVQPGSILLTGETADENEAEDAE